MVELMAVPEVGKGAARAATRVVRAVIAAKGVEAIVAGRGASKAAAVRMAEAVAAMAAEVMAVAATGPLLQSRSSGAAQYPPQSQTSPIARAEMNRWQWPRLPLLWRAEIPACP